MTWWSEIPTRFTNLKASHLYENNPQVAEVGPINSKKDLVSATGKIRRLVLVGDRLHSVRPASLVGTCGMGRNGPDSRSDRFCEG